MRINRSTDCDKPLRRIFASSKGKIGLIGVWGGDSPSCATFVISQENKADIYIEAGYADICIQRAFNDRMVIQAYSSCEKKLYIYIPAGWDVRTEIAVEYTQQSLWNSILETGFSRRSGQSGRELTVVSRQVGGKMVNLQECQDTYYYIAKERWIFVKKIILNGEMLFIPESASAK